MSPMWGTFLLDVYRRGDAKNLRDALETVLGPESGSSWATGGVYLFWNPETRDPLYVGLTGDFPERFAQHNGLRSCRASGCQRENIARYFADEGDWLGYTAVVLSSLSQPSTRRQRSALGLTDPELIELNEVMSADVVDEMRALEGRMIALYAAQCGEPIRWNVSPGRIPQDAPDTQDPTLALAVGVFDSLLQARRTIRQLASDGQASMFEEHLHGGRLHAIMTGRSVRRWLAGAYASPPIRDEILRTGYLDQQNPVTVRPGSGHDGGPNPPGGRNPSTGT